MSELKKSGGGGGGEEKPQQAQSKLNKSQAQQQLDRLEQKEKNTQSKVSNKKHNLAAVLEKTGKNSSLIFCCIQTGGRIFATSCLCVSILQSKKYTLNPIAIARGYQMV
ncbi:hypothetical protein KRR40_20025 [Niabella defluvii]|nr:hypothetical protein KRR40_20025 [Niabella sp. I65]